MKNETFDKSRVLSFSDAVFSIAVTLLILEIVIPSYKELKTNETWTILRNRIPSFIGLVVSFMVIVLYWISHLRVMKYVSVVTNKLLWQNIYLLFFIILLPFSTAYYVKGFDYIGPFVFYCFNLSAIGLFNFLMVLNITNKKNRNKLLTKEFVSFLKLRSLNGLCIWVLAGLIGLKFPYFARLLFLLLFFIEFLIGRRYKKQVQKRNAVE